MTMIGDIAKLPASVADAAPARPQVSVATVGDYVALLKPRVMSLVVFTALVGLVVAPGHDPSGARASRRCSASRSAPAPPARSTCGTTPTSTR